MLEEVFEEDQTIVNNCIHVLEKIKPDKVFSTWTCTKSNPSGFYIVTAYMNSDRDYEFTLRELDAVQEVNPVRVVSVSVCRQASVNSVQIKISDKNQPIILTETQVTCIRKRARWAR